MPSHFRRLAVLAAVFAGAAALLATPLYRASAPTDAGGPVQYGDVVHVPLASNACASLLDPARGWSDLHLFVSGLDLDPQRADEVSAGAKNCAAV